MVIPFPGFRGPRLLTFDDAEEPTCWIPFETFLPVEVRGLPRGTVVLWIDHRMVSLPVSRFLLPQELVEMEDVVYLWAGERWRCNPRVPFHCAVLQLPDSTPCIVCFEHLFQAIREFLPEMANRS